jgi:vitamin K-dependent gamma-carboxylase
MERLARPIDAAWLVAARFVFGMTMFVSMARFIAYGWIDRFFVAPRFHFTYWGFEWVEPLPAAAMHGLFWAMAALALAFALGLWFRVVAFMFAVGFAYLQLVDVTIYLNHYYGAWLFGLILAVSPAGSHGALRLRSRSFTPIATVPTAWLALLRFQVAVVYVFAGVAKMHADWLVYAQPLRIWLGAATDLPLVGPWFTVPGVPLAMSWAGMLFDTTIVGWLLWRRTRPFAFVAVVVFHILTRMLFPIGMFPVIMIGAALVFFDPTWPRDLRAWIVRVATRETPVGSAVDVAPVPSITPAFRVGVAIGCVYALVQVAMPLRSHVYAGNVLWHEQGMRFSWRVMVREKNGSVTFTVSSPQLGRRQEVAPSRYLNDHQAREMAGQPDLLLQLAHRIRDDYAVKWGTPVEVRVRALMSLNGRRGALLVDPELDLAKVELGFAAAPWILPEPVGPPPRTRPVR